MPKTFSTPASLNKFWTGCNNKHSRKDAGPWEWISGLLSLVAKAKFIDDFGNTSSLVLIQSLDGQRQAPVLREAEVFRDCGNDTQATSELVEQIPQGGRSARTRRLLHLCALPGQDG
jgi:hypothetical protein